LRIWYSKHGGRPAREVKAHLISERRAVFRCSRETGGAHVDFLGQDAVQKTVHIELLAVEIKQHDEVPGTRTAVD
jgi:hypothetical protein